MGFPRELAIAQRESVATMLHTCVAELIETKRNLAEPPHLFALTGAERDDLVREIDEAIEALLRARVIAT